MLKNEDLWSEPPDFGPDRPIGGWAIGIVLVCFLPLLLLGWGFDLSTTGPPLEPLDAVRLSAAEAVRSQIT